MATHHETADESPQLGAQSLVTRLAALRGSLPAHPSPSVNADHLQSIRPSNTNATYTDERAVRKISKKSRKARRNKVGGVRSNIGEADERSRLSLASHLPHDGPRPSDGTKALLVHQQRVASLRANVQIARTQLRAGRQSWMQYNYYLLEALEQYMGLVRRAMLQQDRMLALREEFEDAYANVMSSKEDLYEEEEKTKELVNQVSNLEYQYGLQEKALCECIARTTGLPLPAETLLDERVGHVRSDGDKPDVLPKKVPKALRDYYDKAGDITIFRERLLHMQADHHQEAMARENRVTLGPSRKFATCILRHC